MKMTRALLRLGNLIRGRQFSSAGPAPSPIIQPEVLYKGIFVNNEWHNSKSGKTFKTINPATEDVIAEIQHSSKEDVNFAVDAAYDAFKFGSPWRTMDASERAKKLCKLADLLERDANYIASLETIDSGKPYAHCFNFDLPFSVAILRYMAGWADKNCGKTIPVNGNYMCYTRHEPVGVCAQIIPWNGPLVMAAMKVASALCMGNTVVLKPAELTPLTALYLAQLSKEAGFPPGVLNVVPGYGDAGAALVENPKVDKIAFTGSTEVGLKIQQASGTGKLKRTSLELGGKSPNIILADANIKEAVELAHHAVFFNQGQVCCAGTRLYVEEPIYNEFVERSAERAKKRVIGDPFDQKTEQGPQINKNQMNKILGYIKTGVKEGAQLVTGGNQYGTTGYFIEPTVFSNVQDHHTIGREEIFGPVQQLFKFKQLDEIIERANDTRYGLAAGIMSNDLDKVNYLVQGIKAGTVWVNCYNALGPQQPFGGFKDSGHGRELSEYGLSQYTEVKTVTIRVPKKNS